MGKLFDLHGAQFLQVKVFEHNAVVVVRGQPGLALFLQRRTGPTWKLRYVLLVGRSPGSWLGEEWKSGVKFLLGFLPSDQGPKEEKEKEGKNLPMLLLICQPSARTYQLPASATSSPPLDRLLLGTLVCVCVGEWCKLRRSREDGRSGCGMGRVPATNS